MLTELGEDTPPEVRFSSRLLPSARFARDYGVLSPELLDRLDLRDAVENELTANNRLLPRRWDHAALIGHEPEVTKWLKPRLRSGAQNRPADLILADKGWRGSRPLSVMNLEHRVLYRALVSALARALPQHVRERPPIDKFKRAPLETTAAEYITKTDVTSYYSYVDHDLLADELTAQTGDELAISALSELLETIMGRRVGLPQIHTASDVLGDAYIDRARRRLRRRGFIVFTYSDDFRIASDTLGSARSALDACALEVRDLGLVLNERKTYTYGRVNYEEYLSAFSRAEQALFDQAELSAIELFFTEYATEDTNEPIVLPSLGSAPVESSLDDDEATEDNQAESDDADAAQRHAAAEKAWDNWLNEEESEDAQSRIEASVTQSLLARSLRALGAAQSSGPLENLSELLRFEPGLAPQVAEYLIKYCAHGPKARANVRGAINDVLNQDIISTWQAMWIAHALGYVKRLQGSRPAAYLDWLTRCVATGPDGLAATASASLGRLNYGDPAAIAAAIDRIGPEWRPLALWGLARIDQSRAADSVDNQLDRIMLGAT